MSRYAWTIAECGGCQQHMGWKFSATSRRLTPRKFWGVSRQSVRPQLAVDANMMQLSGEGLANGVLAEAFIEGY